MPFDRNVFVNCPFDDEFLPLLRPLLFTILYLGFRPRIALESLDSGEPRIQKILTLIRESKYGIHDFSRIKARKRGEYFRLNMPLEMGADLGCKTFGSGKSKQKRILMMCSERYEYQAAISDFAGSDIQVHENEAKNIVVIAREWLRQQGKLRSIDGPSRIWLEFNQFMADNHVKLTASGHSKRDIQKLRISALVEQMEEWLAS